MKKMLIGCMSALALSALVDDTDGMMMPWAYSSSSAPRGTPPSSSTHSVPPRTTATSWKDALKELFKKKDTVPLTRQETRLLKDFISNVERNLDAKIAKIPADMTRVLLLGNTGAGKTTLLHNLAGVRFTGVQDKYSKVHMMCDDSAVLRDESGKLFDMRPGMESVTFEPNIWLDTRNRIAYFDCPGFLDSSVSKRLVNAFAIDRILAAPCQVKMLLVSAASDFDSAKGGLIKDSIETLESMLPEGGQLEQALGFVLTKGDPMIPAVTTFSQLEQMDLPPRTVDYFLANPGHIFAFPNAQAKKTYVFRDKNAVIQFLTQSPVSNPEHCPFIDPKGQLLALQMGKEFSKDEKVAIDALIDTIRAESGKLTSLDSIRLYQDKIQSLKIASSQGLDRFVQVCRELVSISRAFATPTQELTRLTETQSFVRKVLQLDPRLLDAYKEDTLSLSEAFKPVDFIHDSLILRENYELKQIEVNQKIADMAKERQEAEIALQKEVADGKMTQEQQKEELARLKSEHDGKIAELRDRAEEGQRKLEQMLKDKDEEMRILREKLDILMKEKEGRLDEKIKRFFTEIVPEALENVVDFFAEYGEVVVDTAVRIYKSMTSGDSDGE